MSFTAFEVYVNGEHLCCAGGPNISVLAATLTLSIRHAKGNERVVEFRVGGMSSADAEGGAKHLDWAHLKDIVVGTEITFKVVNASEADSPSEA